MIGYPYLYDEMLFRLHKTKSLDDTCKNIKLPVLQVSCKNKCTIISNFGDYPKILGRQLQQLLLFFKTELAVNLSVNANNQLIINGIFNEMKCENIMRNYIREFVLCRQCKYINTSQIKKSGVTYIQCNECNATTSLGKLHN